MREKEFLQCQHFSCLPEPGVAGGVSNQSVPIVLPVSDGDKQRLEGAPAVCLRYGGEARAVVRDPEFYRHRKEERAARQFGTVNPGHPYVRIIMDGGDWLVGGEVEVLGRVTWGDGMDQYRWGITGISPET